MDVFRNAHAPSATAEAQGTVREKSVEPAGKVNRQVSSGGQHSDFPYCLVAAADGANAFLERYIWPGSAAPYLEQGILVGILICALGANRGGMR